MATAKKAAKKPAKKPAAKKPAAKKPAAKKAPAKKAAPKKAAPKKAAKKPAAKRKPNAAFMKAMTPTGALAAVVGAMPLPRTEVTKKIWDYIKKNKLQDSINRRLINADEKLKAGFRRQEAGVDVRNDQAGLKPPQVIRLGQRAVPASAPFVQTAGHRFAVAGRVFFYFREKPDDSDVAELFRARGCLRAVCGARSGR